MDLSSPYAMAEVDGDMTKRLLVLFFCLLLVMIGFGITLPVFPFYAELLAREGGASQGAATANMINHNQEFGRREAFGVRDFKKQQ